MKKTYTVAFHTLGCKVSQYETEAIREEFLRRGFIDVPFSDKADVYVVNTCTVTAESDRKSRQMIRRALSLSPGAVMMVVGCYSQTSPDEVAAIPGVSYVSGSGNKMKIPEEAEKILRAREENILLPVVTAVTDIDTEPFEPMCVKIAPRTRAYVKIEDGCECRCTYCAIPGARGCVRSKSPDDVLAEVNALAASGTREVVLTGIETASYGVDLGDFRLIDLLERIEKESPVDRIRLGSITPEILKRPFAERLIKLKKPVPHFHISVQSGSDDVLRTMHRRYNRRQALDGIHLLREMMPNLMLTTDMMVGFPGETEENFRDTCDFAREADFLSMHIFAYSRRKGTPADKFPSQIPEDVKHFRAATLAEIAEELRNGNLQRTVEKREPLSVLFETFDGKMSYGHSDSFIEVAVAGNETLHGKILSVMPRSHQNGIIFADILDNSI